ncbi:MAG: elongation factor Ts [Clostridia bacterium]|nr:elongation factor Ts [Clostridia bacterium]
MANISAKDVAELRKQTGIGMMECKKALVEADGDFEAAVKLLREKGELKAASKIANRIAADGIVSIMKDGDYTAMIEVNSETDFVAKNESFQEFVANLLKTILATKPANVEELMAAQYVEGGVTVEEKVKEEIFKIGEKLSIRRFALIEGLTATYIHGAGSIGVIVKFDTDCGDKDGFADFAKNIALQIGAYPTPYLTRNDVPASVIEAEKEIIKVQLANDPKMANKPEKVLDGIIMGKLGKYYEANCLVDMAYVKEDDMTVGQYVAKTAKELGGNITIASFSRFEKGEGIEKKEEDYAAEVAKLAAGK